MDDNLIYLIVEINYENKKYKIEREEEITYNELREESIKHFNIDIKNGDNIEFIYIDEEQEKNILEHDDEDIFSLATYINNNYKLNLDLIKVNNQKPNVENKINENKKEVNNINKDKGEENKGIKSNNNEIGNKLKLINSMFKNQLHIMQKDISKMINNKYKEIENELLELNMQVNNINNNVNIPRSKNVKERQAKNFQISNEKNKDIENDEEINFGKSSTFSYYKNKVNDIDINQINNEIKKNMNLNEGNINSTYSDEEDKEDENYDREGDMQGSHGININNKKNKNIEKIKKAINNLYKAKSYSYNDIVTKGNSIFDIIDKKEMPIIDLIDIKEDLKKYLIEEHKKPLSIKEAIKYCNILEYLNHFLEIKKVTKYLDDGLKEEIEDKIEEEKNKDKEKKKDKKKEKNKENEGENIDENKIKSLFDSFNKNNNKKYVQNKIQDLLKKFNFEFKKQ